MRCWTAGQLAAFLNWSAGHSSNHPLWHFLANTGERRGEALSQRRADLVDDPAAIRVRRSFGLVRLAGEGAEIVEGSTKSGRPRTVDLDGDRGRPWAPQARPRHHGPPAGQAGRAHLR